MVAVALGLQQDNSLKTIYTIYVPRYIIAGKGDEKHLLLHDWETLSEHNLSIMTQWGKHKMVILLALKHSIIIEKNLVRNMLKPISKAVREDEICQAG